MVKKFLYGTFDISHKYKKIPHEVLRPRNYEVNTNGTSLILLIQRTHGDIIQSVFSPVITYIKSERSTIVLSVIRQ